MGVGCVGQGGLEVCPHLDLLCISYHEPRYQLGEHFQDGALVVPHVFLMQGFYVLLVNVRDNCIDASLADDLLVYKALPQGQLLLLKLEEVYSLLDLPIGVAKLKDLQTHLRVQIPVSAFHVGRSVPTFLH